MAAGWAVVSPACGMVMVVTPHKHRPLGADRTAGNQGIKIKPKGQRMQPREGMCGAGDFVGEV